MAWYEAITTGRKFDALRDIPRFRQSFTTLMATRESWPAPKHFLDAMPRVEQVAIRYEVKPASKEQAEQRISDIRAEFERAEGRAADGKTAAAGSDA